MEHTIETDLNQTGFLEEARGYSPLVVACLDALAANLDDRIALDEIFRLAHTIRGAGGTAGLDEVSTIAQGAEELAEAILNGDLPMDAESVDLFREAFNGLFEAIERAAPVADGGPPKPKAKKNARPQMVETIRAEDVPPELIEGFLIEAAENLALVETSLAEFELDQSKKQLLKDARRGVHTIKGAGGMVGQWTLAKLAKRVEDLLDEVYDGERKWSEDLRDLVEASRGALSDVVASGGNPAGHEDLLAALHEAYDLLNPQEETTAKPVPERAPVVTIAADAPMGDGLLEGFLEEAAGLLEGLDGLITAIPTSRETVQEVRRRVHTIKGSAGMVGLRGLSQIAHRMEDLLDRLYEGTVEHSASLEPLLTATGDTIADMLGHGGTAAAYTDRLLDLYRRYDEIGNEAPTSEPETLPLALVPVRTPSAAAAAAAEPPPSSNEAGAQHVRVPIEKLDEMVRLVGELFAVRSSLDRSLAGYRHEIGELELTLRRLRRIATQFENEYAIYSPGVTDGPAAARSAHGADRSEFDALEFDRYTQFHLLSRDLMEAVSDIATAEHLLTTLAGDFDLSLNRQGRLTSEVQDRLMHLRMVPLSTLAARLQRTVRVTAERTGKQVNLSLEGFAVEIDKTALEQLAGPLEHLLRNAVDHGIEPTSARLAAGKDGTGSIHIEASYEGTQIVIRLSDDGAGLDAARIAETAVKRGLITIDQALSLDQDSLLALIFEPGFTTAEIITEISGRGVGLDIVKSVADALKGTVSVATETGQWTSFTLRLPMSLSITKVLLVEASQETYALPLGSVVQVARVDYGQIETIAGKRVVRHERRLVPAVWLSEALALPKAPVPGAKQSLVVIQAGGDRHALMVDRILEARQVMVNPPAGILRKAPAIAGTTVMGDGSVVLVLNPVEVVMPQHVATTALPRRPIQPKFVELPSAFDVLVVDDSLSVRRVVSNLMQKSGWNPIQAKDGVEALETLRRLERLPDVILLDVEMPRMDGYEFAAAIRGSKTFKQIPIIMLTSRAGDKHRKKAMDAGVNGYLVKPYQDENLVSIIKEWVARGRGEI